MQIKRFPALLFLLILFFISGCKEAPTIPPEETFPDYFPLSAGNYFVYNVDSLTNTGPVRIGTHISRVVFTDTINRIPYLLRTDTLFTASYSLTGQNRIRKTDNGVYMFVDTTGLTAFIPDSLRSFLSIDREANILSKPYYPGREWSGYSFLILNVPIISLRCILEENTITSQLLNGSVQQVRMQKLRYVLTLQNPDTSASPLQYSAVVSYGENIGIMNIEGDAEILTLLLGVSLSPGARFSYNLKEYSVILP